jgi:glucokinase
MSEYVIGIDLGGTFIKGAAFDPTGKILSEEKAPTEVALGKDGVVQNIVGLISRLKQKNPGRLAGVGLGVPGALDFKEGRIIQSPNFPGWEDVPIRAWVEKEVGAPVILENDANAAAMGERWVGAARDLDHFLLITLGTGVGGGLVLNGRLWRGVYGKAGEIGHMKITEDGPRCGCGNRGCLEVYASSKALVRMAKEQWKNKRKKTPFPFMTSDKLAKGAEEGNPIARRAFEEMAAYLSIGIVNIVNLLDIDRFIIAGGVSNAFYLFEPSLRQEVADRVFGMDTKEALKRIEIRRALCGENAGMIGAGYLALYEKATL